MDEKTAPTGPESAPVTSASSSSNNVQVQIASDLHVEFVARAPDIWQAMLTPKAPLLALCGDIGCPGSSGVAGWKAYEAFIRFQAAQFEQVLLIMGNHEYYINQKGPGGTVSTVDEVNAKVEQLCKDLGNVVLMNRKSMVVGNVRIIGATLWSKVPKTHEQEVWRCLMDYYRIHVEQEEADGTKKKVHVDVQTTNAWHEEDLKFIREELKAASQAGQRALVLTHHGPTFQNASDPVHKNSKIRFAFCTELSDSDLFSKKGDFASLDTWVFGHTHWNVDQRIRGVRVVANQHGYAHEKNKDFNPSLVLSFPEK